MRGGGGAHFPPVARGKEERDVGDGSLMAPDLEERSGDVAHHFVEKAVPLKLKAQERVMVGDVEAG